MDAAETIDGEKVYAGAKALVTRWRTQGRTDIPLEVMQIQDVLELIELNADRIAHALKDCRRRRAGTMRTDIKMLLTEQDRRFSEIARLVQQLSRKRFVGRDGSSA